MRIVVAVSENHLGCADLVPVVASFPWPTEAVFSVLTVAEIIPPPLELAQDVVSIPDMQSTAEATSMSAVARLKKAGLDAQPIERDGDPKRVIVEYAVEWRADLVVVGSC